MDRHRETIAEPTPSPRACLVDGCPCKDARIVSRRLASFFAAKARQNGQTADRAIAQEAGWWPVASTLTVSQVGPD